MIFVCKCDRLIKYIYSIYSSMTKKYKKLFEDKREKHKYYVGLRNLGNTCYMNALLQALTSCELYMKYIESV